MTTITKFGKWYWGHILKGLGLENGWRTIFRPEPELPFKEDMKRQWRRFVSMVIVIVVPHLFLLALLALQVLTFLVVRQLS